MVEVELNIEANDEITAAARAANERPLTIVGVKLRINQGYASSGRSSEPARESLKSAQSGEFMM